MGISAAVGGIADAVGGAAVADTAAAVGGDVLAGAATDAAIGGGIDAATGAAATLGGGAFSDAAAAGAISAAGEGAVGATAADAAGSSFGSILSGVSTAGSLVGGAANVAKGVAGLAQGSSVNSAAQAAASKADPFGPQRAQYGQMLSSLMANPSSLSTTPGYQAGLEAVQRTQAAEGFTGSGNAQNALLQYGGNIFNQQAALLGNLAGAGINPGTAAGISLQGATDQASLTGQGINSLMYGAQQLAGSPTTNTGVSSPSANAYGGG